MSPSVSEANALAWPHREQQVAGPFVSADLPLACALLRSEPAYQREGHTARTLAKYRDLRVVLVAMKAGTHIRAHETAERLAIDVLAGRLRVWLRGGQNQDAGEGTFLAVDAEQAEGFECVEDCAFTLTVAWPPQHDTGDPVEM